MTTKRGEAASILPSEIKGRKRTMTDAEFVALLAKERREIETAGRALIDRTWKAKNIRGMGVQG